MTSVHAHRIASCQTSPSSSPRKQIWLYASSSFILCPTLTYSFTHSLARLLYSRFQFLLCYHYLLLLLGILLPLLLIFSLLSPSSSSSSSCSSFSHITLVTLYRPPATTNQPPARWVLLIPNNRRRPHRLTKPICLCPQSPILILWQSPPPALFLIIQLMTMGMAVTAITIRVQTARQHCHRGAHHCSSSTSHSSYLYRLRDTFSAS